jgi:hypothetical protein
MVQAMWIRMNNPGDRFAASCMSYSNVCTNTIMDKLSRYVKDTKERAEEISNGANKENGKDLKARYHATMIRDNSLDALFGMELLKASLDRFILADEDIPSKKKRNGKKRGRDEKAKD